MILPTLDQKSAAHRRWDAIVIGAGPAGAMAARELALRQKNVLLVERKSVPRDKVCGACLNGRAMSILEQTGLAPQLTALNAVPLRQMEFAMKGRVLRVALPGGAAVSRATFDAALVQAAILAGAAFLPRVQAWALPHSEKGSPAGRVIKLSQPGEADTWLEAGVVVAADGLGHPSLAACPEFAPRIARHSRLGLGATVSTNLEAYERGTIFMALGKAGYVGAVRLGDGRLNLAASVDQAALRAAGQPAELVAGILAEAGRPVPANLDQADWQGTAPLTRRTPCVAALRVFLAGDAAGYVEPFTGEGIGWALTTGRALAPFVERALSEPAGQAERAWRSAHHRLIVQQQGWCRLLAWTLRRPPVAETLLRLMTVLPGLPRFLVQHLNRPLTAWE